MIEAIRSAYEVFENLNLSVGGVLAIALFLFLAFLFSVREAASWFFKVNDLKRDVQDLHEVCRDLRAEIRTLQFLMSQLKSTVAEAPTTPPREDPAPLKASEKPGGFTITH